MFQLLGLDAVAAALAVSKHTVRSWVRQGRLKPTRVCRRLLFHPQDVEEFVRASQAGSTQPKAQADRTVEATEKEQTSSTAQHDLHLWARS
jgi:excisionase family DNA binding protein